jgi:hypothetical protein
MEVNTEPQVDPISVHLQISQNRNKAPLPLIVGILLFFILISGGIIISISQKKQVPVSHTIAPLNQPTTTPSVDPTTTWKPFSIGSISFKYPPEFKDPELITTAFGYSAEIKNIDNSQRIIVISGLNKGYSEKELTEYLDLFVQGGGQKLFLDDNEAVIMKDADTGSKITTVYMNAKDKKSQYSISIQSSESFDDKKIETLLNQIFATLKFE